MTTPIFGFPELTGNTNEKTLVNLVNRYQEALSFPVPPAQINVSTVPTSPTDGSVYLINGTPTGVWSGQAGKAGINTGSGWFFAQRHPGYTYSSGTWTANAGGGGGSITVQEVDSTPSEAPTTTIKFQNDSLTVESPGVVRFAPNYQILPYQSTDPSPVPTSLVLFARPNGNLYVVQPSGTVVAVGSGGGSPVGGFSDTFLGTNGAPIIGRVPTNPNGAKVWFKNISTSGNGEIQSNKAVQGAGAALTANYDTGLTSYTMTVNVNVASYSPSIATAIIIRGNPTYPDAPCLALVLYNNTIALYDAPINVGVGSSVLYPLDSFVVTGDLTVVITVTPTTVDINVNSGLYTKTVTTSLYSTNTGVGIQSNGVGVFDSISVVP